MATLTWLVYHTNPSGDHDAWLLPFIPAILIGIGLLQMIRSRRAVKGS